LLSSALILQRQVLLRKRITAARAGSRTFVRTSPETGISNQTIDETKAALR
jgi:hypothetical protein